MPDRNNCPEGICTLCLTLLLIASCGGSGGGGGTPPLPVATGGVPGSANSSPSISGNAPATTVVGMSYSYTPEASDPDGDPLSFAIDNQPVWTNFDPGTGQLSGVANAGTEGRYDNIRITVSDGQATASTTFSIDVVQAALGSVTLSWEPPQLNEDGTPLNDLSGYVIYFGTQSRNYANSIEIDNPGIVTYMVENLPPSTYYFASTAVNSDGLESDFSNEAVRVVDAP